MFSDRTNWKLTTNRFTQAVEEARLRGERLFDLTVSNPTRAGLKYDERAILAALASPRALDYDPQSKGLLAAREAVAGDYRGERGGCGVGSGGNCLAYRPEGGDLVLVWVAGHCGGG